MKKLLILFAAWAALTACEGNETPSTGNQTTGNRLYSGTTTVTSADVETPFVAENTRFELVPQTDGTMRMLMHETRFAERMPAMDMEVPGIACTGTETLSLSVASTIPEIAGTPYPRYTITDLTGTADNASLAVNFKVGDYQIAYQGTKTE